MNKKPSSHSRRNPAPAQPQRFVKPWIEISVGHHPKTIAELISLFPADAPLLQEMERDKIELEPAGASCDLPLLVTTDPAIATKYDMILEEIYWYEQEAASE